MRKLTLPSALLALCVLSATANAQWTTVWQLGEDGREWPGTAQGVTGIPPDIFFVQEAGTNPPPGNPDSPNAAQQADDDYYFGGVYPAPIGTVDDEMVMERAFAGSDNDLRIHFNLPTTLGDDDFVRFTLGANNLHTDAADPRYGVEVSFNGTVIMPEVIIRPGDLDSTFTSNEVTFGSVGAIYGEGGDNIISLRGINYNGDGGGNWMGMDFHHLETSPIPEPATYGVLLGGLAVAAALLRRRSLRPRG